MKLRVRLFASLREAAGTEGAVVEVPEGITVGRLFSILCKSRKGLEGFGENVLAAVNETQTEWTRVLHDGDVVAFYPPVGGG